MKWLIVVLRNAALQRAAAALAAALLGALIEAVQALHAPGVELGPVADVLKQSGLF